jgi:hypothetical protein
MVDLGVRKEGYSIAGEFEYHHFHMLAPQILAQIVIRPALQIEPVSHEPELPLSVFCHPALCSSAETTLLVGLLPNNHALVFIY